MEEKELVWNLFCELRKEIIENQKTRSLIRQVQFTFMGGVSSGLFFLIFRGVSFSNANDTYSIIFLLVILSFLYISSVGLDLTSSSYEISTNRIGRYIRNNLEVYIKSSYSDEEFKKIKLWENYIHDEPVYIEPFIVFSLVQRFINTFLYSIYVSLSLLMQNNFPKVIDYTNYLEVFPIDLLNICSVSTFIFLIIDWISFIYVVIITREWYEDIQNNSK